MGTPYRSTIEPSVLDQFLAWAMSDNSATIVHVALFVAITLGIAGPRNIRRRMRAAVTLGLVFVGLRVVAHVFFPKLNEHEDYHALCFCIGGLAVARVAFVLVVDVIV